MSVIKAVPPVQLRLSASDFARFDKVCRQNGKTRTEQVRIVVRDWLDKQESEIFEERENELEKRLKKIKDHMASLLVRLGVDVNTPYFMLWIAAILRPEKVFGRLIE